MIAVSSEVIHPVERFKVSKLTKHPNNPRILRDAQYQTLKKSIEDNPDLLEARPLILSNRTGKNIVIGGNQRLQVVKDLGWLTVPCVMFPDLTEEKEREIMIRDNVSNGEWDFEALASDWDSSDLQEWGLDVPDWGADVEGKDEFSLPDGDKPPFQNMTFTFSDCQADEIKEAIEIAKENNDVETFGNENSNGNALYRIVLEWRQQKI
jgi:hypothetical protein